MDIVWFDDGNDDKNKDHHNVDDYVMAMKKIIEMIIKFTISIVMLAVMKFNDSSYWKW